MQGLNLCLRQDFFLCLNEEPRQHFDQVVFHGSPFSGLRHLCGLPWYVLGDRARLTRYFLADGASFLVSELLRSLVSHFN